MNPDIIREARRDGEPVYYGDATQPEVLHQVKIGRASCRERVY
jgi:voltage-gated potassium channel Kch